LRGFFVCGVHCEAQAISHNTLWHNTAPARHEAPKEPIRISQASNNLAAYIWSLADLLRGDFKQSQYGRVILPFTLLRRLECVLEPTKPAVLAEYEKVEKLNLPEEAQEKLLLRATGGLAFFNTSKMDLSKLGEAGIKANLESYLKGFSKDAREIFENFKFGEFVGQLNDANLLFKIVQKVRATDLSPKAISNHDMGLVFEELIRRFAESSNETAGEHFTPRDIVRLKECKKEKDALDIFKKDLGTFVRFYEFMSQIVDYANKQLEKLSLYARNLRPMLRETIVDDDDIDLNAVVLSHYRLSKIRQQDLQLQENSADYKLVPGEGLGSATSKDKKAEFLSQIIQRLNDLFVTDQLTENDMVNYAYTIRDKVSENALVMKQIANNSAEQAMLGDFSKAVDNAIMDSGEAHQNQMLQLLSDPAKAAKFAKVVFELLTLSE